MADESNAISADDFSKLENTEDKRKGLFGKVFGKKEEEKKEQAPAETPPMEINDAMTQHDLVRSMQELKSQMSQMTIAVEKLEGKLEFEEDSDKTINERILEVGERVGEVRSMVLDRERFFNNMEVEFENIKDAVHDIKPERIQKTFEEKDKLIIDLQAKTEKLDHLMKKTNEEITAYRKLMDNIKGFENMVHILNEIDQKMKHIEKNKQYTERMARKIEALFYEVNAKVKTPGLNAEKITIIEDMLKDLMKNMDTHSVKLEKHATKDDLDKEVEKLKKELEIVKETMFDKELKLFSSHLKKDEKKAEKSHPLKHLDHSHLDQIQNLIEQERAFIRQNDIQKARDTHKQISDVVNTVHSRELKSKIIAQWSKINEEMKA